MNLPSAVIATDCPRVAPPPQAVSLQPGSVATVAPLALVPATIEALRRIEAYAPARTPVVFVGETGTGKSHFARWLHERSGREGPFEDIAAGELMGSLARDELMGHERGAFTGAMGRRLGLIATAGQGTLMIDDFHLLRRAVQYLLLRLFDRGLYRRVGSDREAPMQCRLAVGIGADPDDLVARGRLLADLRYRLGHCVVRIPRLEERREEIRPFVEHFLARAPEETGALGGPMRIEPQVIAVCEIMPWPGNVRDLRKAVEAAYLHARGEREEAIRLKHLPVGRPVSLLYDARADLISKRRLVAWALWKTGGRIGEAARLTRASRNTVSAVWRGMVQEPEATRSSR